MNKLTKVGLSALCGSLASVSAAQAGSIDVSGGATATWTTVEGDVTGNPIGMNSGITFKGSGELDNGTTFSLTLTQTDATAYSGGSIVLTTPSLGEFSLGHANGANGIDAFDDVMPTAWEETDGTGLTVGHDKISGVGASTNVQWKSPVMGASYIAVAYAPKNDGAQATDKAATGGTTKKQEGWDVRFNLGTGSDSIIGGLNIFAGYSLSAQANDEKAGAGSDKDNQEDHEEGVAGFTYAYGPVKIGLQKSAEYLGNEATASDVMGYTNTAWGVSFNISDNLSISYGESDTKKGYVSGETESIRGSAKSYQLAYTVGGASIKIAESEVDNQNYVTTTAADKESTTVALSLAF